MTRFAKFRLALVPIAFLTWLNTSSSQQKSGATVIINAQIADGTGQPLRKASVRISGDRIVKVGDFQPSKDEQIIDAKGLVLAPGFIDIHNHSTQGIESDPLAETQIAQGITTLVVGADGDSPWPIAPI
jgi:N-acyl-D-amino-acid deacylase